MTEESILKQQDRADRAHMLLSSFLCIFPGFTYGASMSYISISLPHYINVQSNSAIFMNQEQASWFVCLSSPMKVVGLLSASWLADRFGRKPVLISGCALLMIGSFVLFISPVYSALLLGIAISGFAQGMMESPGYLLLSEISLIRYRGTLSTINTTTINIGYVYGLIFGNMVPFNYLPMLSLFPGLIFLCLSWYLVESPLWYVKKGRVPMAKKTLHWLRGPNYSLKSELQELEDLTSVKSSSSSLSILGSRYFLIPLSITFMCFGIQVVTSIDALVAYMLTLLKNSSLPISGVTIAVLFHALCTLGYMISPLLLAKLNRRPVFLMSTITIACCLLTLGLFSSIQGDSFLTKVGPIVCLLMISLSYGLGIGPLSFGLVGELFPSQLRSLGCSLAITSRYLFMFMELKMFSSLVNILGMGGTYFLHGGFVLVGSVLAFFFLPETKNLSFSEIQQLFDKSSVEDKVEISIKKWKTTVRRRSSVSCSS